ncbi:MAG: DUF305 domain-containing protein [Alteraurantiacibacter sp.]
MFARRIALASASLGAILLATTASAQSVRIIQPGAPGMQNRVLTEAQAMRVADNGFIQADVNFMQMMIPHHQQAVTMSQLVEGRTTNAQIIEAAGRILASQDGEINFMRDWLMERGAPVEMDHSMHGAGHMDMQGMATAQQLAALRAASGEEFDRMFLQLMTEHHRGAIAMLEDLAQVRGSGADPVLWEFAVGIYQDQSAEIARMNGILTAMDTDPRVGLGAGLFDAEEAISNLRHVRFLKKPAGFYDPGSPSGLPREVPGSAEQGRVRYATRSGPLSFSNTDMAFQGDLFVAGNYNGWNAYRLDDNGIPQLEASVVCPGGQGDVSIVGDLLIMSVEQTTGRVDCGREVITEDASPDRFRGVRIFDISDITNPTQVGLVQTCRGSHTHSVVDVDDTRILLYNSGTSSVRDEGELAGCIDAGPTNERTALFSIDVIEIPLADPSRSRIVSSPRIFADDEGNIAGLWAGGNHGPGTQSSRQTNQCHDITVFPSRNIAAGACSGNGILMDISDPYNPTRLDAVTDDGFAYWHSATFNNDGTIVLFTDEWGGGGQPRCQASDPMDWGADAFYEIVGNKLERRGTYKLPAAQSESENCVAHNGSIIPVPGRDIFVQAWYQGGLSVIDFTDPNNPFEIAYFDRGPVDADRITTGGYWSTYYYNGKIYATEIARGIDVFELVPSEHLTQAEIDAAAAADMGDTFNPQTQYPVTWTQDQIDAATRSRRGG